MKKKIYIYIDASSESEFEEEFVMKTQENFNSILRFRAHNRRQVGKLLYKCTSGCIEAQDKPKNQQRRAVLISSIESLHTYVHSMPSHRTSLEWTTSGRPLKHLEGLEVCS